MAHGQTLGSLELKPAGQLHKNNGHIQIIPNGLILNCCFAKTMYISADMQRINYIGMAYALWLNLMIFMAMCLKLNPPLQVFLFLGGGGGGGGVESPSCE